MGINQYSSKEEIKLNFIDKINKSNKFELLEYSEDVCKLRCKECGNEFYAKRNKVISRKYCPVCKTNHNKLKNGALPVSETHPYILKFMVDKDLANTHSYGSKELVQCKCPICGVTRYCVLRNLVKRGFSCKNCGDNISFPNKFIYNILREVGIDFISEKSFNWAKNAKGNSVRYDFYIPNLKMIIEANGSQHYEDSNFGFKKDAVDNDNLKEKLAKDNGIEKYIRLDCSKSDENFIINSIKTSKDLWFIDFEKINMTTVLENCANSLLVECCKLFSSDETLMATDVAKLLNIDRHTALKYLRFGEKIGLCQYSASKEEDKRRARAARSRKKQAVIQFDISGDKIREYDSVKSASIYSGVSESNIRSVCLLSSLTAGGFVWEYKDKSILNNVIKNNFDNIKACCELYTKIINGNNFYDTTERMFKTSRFSTFLKYGSILGLIEYNPKETAYKANRCSEERKRAVSQYSTSGEYIATFSSYKHAFEKTGVKIDNIRNSANGRTYAGGGFIWINCGNEENLFDIVKKIKNKQASQYRSVVQYDKFHNYIAEFESISDAKKKTGIKQICKVLSKDHNTAGGYIWEYKCEEVI